jgi:hypothetical protein
MHNPSPFKQPSLGSEFERRVRLAALCQKLEHMASAPMSLFTNADMGAAQSLPTEGKGHMPGHGRLERPLYSDQLSSAHVVPGWTI